MWSRALEPHTWNNKSSNSLGKAFITESRYFVLKKINMLSWNKNGKKGGLYKDSQHILRITS